MKKLKNIGHIGHGTMLFFYNACLNLTQVIR